MVAMLPGAALDQIAACGGAPPPTVAGSALSDDAIRSAANAVQGALPDAVRAKLTAPERRDLVVRVLAALGLPVGVLTGGSGIPEGRL